MAAITQQQQIIGGGLMEEFQEQTFFSPTFSSYSSDKLAEIAARVSSEFKTEEMFIQEDDDEEFEFSLVLHEDESSNVFYDGSKSDESIFPIFKLDFLAADEQISDRENRNLPNFSDEIFPISDGEIRNIPLQELLKRETSEEHDEDDDRANIPPGTYCVWKAWKPKLKQSSSSSSQKMCNKSKSTGSLSMCKRWKILDLLRRSNSHGNESYLFLTPPKHHRDKSSVKIGRPPHPRPPPEEETQQSSDDVVKKNKRSGGGGGRKTPSPSSSPSAHETFYLHNRAIKEGDKKKSYLPYRSWRTKSAPLVCWYSLHPPSS